MRDGAIHTCIFSSEYFKDHLAIQVKEHYALMRITTTLGEFQTRYECEIV